MQVQAYLFFEGRCEEAIAFYGKTLGAKIDMIMRNSESPEPCPEGMLPPGMDNKVLHAAFRIGDSVVMASDGFCGGKPEFKGFSLSLDAATPEEATRMFNALAEGGEVKMPLAKTFFSPCFGMLTDRFGVGWMVIVPAPM